MRKFEVVSKVFGAGVLSLPGEDWEFRGILPRQKLRPCFAGLLVWPIFGCRLGFGLC